MCACRASGAYEPPKASRSVQLYYVERHLHLHAVSAFRIRTMGNIRCGSVAVIVITNHTSRMIQMIAYICDNGADVDASAVLRYNVELDVPCRLQQLICS